jgi:predicted dehydrogenase
VAIQITWGLDPSSDYQPGWRRRTSVAGGGVLMDMLHVVYVAEHLLGRRSSAYRRGS